jgi:hypothetical protein
MIIVNSPPEIPYSISCFMSNHCPGSTLLLSKNTNDFYSGYIKYANKNYNDYAKVNVHHPGSDTTPSC